MGIWSKFGRSGSPVIVDQVDARRRLLERALGPNPQPPSEVPATLDVAAALVGDKLIEVQYARAAQLEAAARSVTVGQVISEHGLAPRAKVVDAIEHTARERLIHALDFEVRLPKRVLRDLKIVVHAQTDRAIYVSSETSETLVLQELTPFVGGRKVEFLPYDFQQWERYEQEIDRILEPDEDEKIVTLDLGAQSIVPPDLDDAEVLDFLISKAALGKTPASDIHIEPQRSGYAVLFRVLGDRVHVHTGSFEQYSRIVAQVKDLSSLDVMETRVPQDGSMTKSVRGKPFDIRVATMPTLGKEKVTMRLLDPERASLPLATLGITEVDLWRRIMENRNGVVLIVGETGSGKTTTMNATLREVNRIERNIISIEDPVEYHLPFVTHVQINKAVDLDFARALRASMRHDPDILVLGEIRDIETARNAFVAAETGHLVIATIHAEAVPMAIQRLVGLGMKLDYMESLLRGIMVQSLVKSLCGTCSGKGCHECGGIGYSGRTVVSEIAQIRSIEDVRAIMSHDAKRIFWRPFWKDLESKIDAGVTDGREVYRRYAADLDLYQSQSATLRKVLIDERAKRGVIMSASTAAQIGEMKPGKQKQSRRQAVSVLAQQMETTVGDDGAPEQPE